MENEKDDLQQWSDWNKQGFIPGPNESKAAFAERVAFCQNLEQHLVEKVGQDLPFESDHQTAQHLLNEAMPLTHELYGIQPRWVPLFCSNYQLAPWHAGCAWIFQLDEKTPMAAFLQLRARFSTSSTYLGLYRRSELIAHELAHVGRMLYHEPQFEEILAYQSSYSTWRRWLGPIVQSSKESLLFIITLALVVMIDLALLSFGNGIGGFTAWEIKLVPLALIIFAFVRLSLRQWQFKKCLKHLKELYQQHQIAHHLIYRLRDNEIKQFARLSPSAILGFMKTASQSSFRWRFLITLYSPSSMD